MPTPQEELSTIYRKFDPKTREAISIFAQVSNEFSASVSMQAIAILEICRTRNINPERLFKKLTEEVTVLDYIVQLATITHEIHQVNFHVHLQHASRVIENERRLVMEYLIYLSAEEIQEIKTYFENLMGKISLFDRENKTMDKIEEMGTRKKH